MARLQAHGFTLPAGVARVAAFGDSAEGSQDLLAQIRAGNKRGGTSLAWAHEADREPIPATGDMEIVVNHRNEPSLVLRFVDVTVVPFANVTAEFAAREGEGDGSLEYWRAAHLSFFERECAR